MYGLKALSNINTEAIEKIKNGRPYTGIKDFMIRCPLNKTAMINLIKAGAFDEIETELDSRKKIMVYYISKICEPKKQLNLQNFNGLIQKNLVPKECEMQVRIYNFTKYLKAYKKVGQFYQLDSTCIAFLEKFLREALDLVQTVDKNTGTLWIEQKDWDKIYQKYMDVARDWLKNNQQEVLSQYNMILFKDCWDKYAKGTISHWEMESLCFYHGDHELKEVNALKYGIVDFNSLQSSEIDYYIKKKNADIPIYKLYRIAGTVIAKNDTKSSISLLTTTGVVTVKFTREYYSMFKKQISQIQPDGTKKVIEKSWFKRGTMLLITGFRRDDQFVGKTYAKTESHQLYKITDVDGEDIKLQHERVTINNSFEEEYDERE